MRTLDAVIYLGLETADGVRGRRLRSIGMVSEAGDGWVEELKPDSVGRMPTRMAARLAGVGLTSDKIAKALAG